MTPEQREALKQAAMAATPGPYVLEQGDGELDSKARWPTDAKVLVFADDDCEHHPVADFSCNHSCRMDFEQEKNALFFSLADPSTILSLIAQVEALTARVVRAERALERAERALLRGGFVDNGAQEWKPPLGPAPKFIEVEAPTVPQGYRIVPIEPTPEMYDAAGASLYGYSRANAIEWAKEDKFESQADSGCDAYRAMLDAALTIPAIPGTKEGA